jgi:hypothetical protein
MLVSSFSSIEHNIFKNDIVYLDSLDVMYDPVKLTALTKQSCSGAAMDMKWGMRQWSRCASADTVMLLELGDPELISCEVSLAQYMLCSAMKQPQQFSTDSDIMQRLRYSLDLITYQSKLPQFRRRLSDSRLSWHPIYSTAGNNSRQQIGVEQQTSTNVFNAPPLNAMAAARVDILKQHVINSLNAAQMFQSKVTYDLLHNLQGMSGMKTRHFYNNLCSLRIDPNRKTEYIEAGTYMGSSLVSAMYMNGATTSGTVIETWKYFGGREAFYANLQKYDIGIDSLTILEGDFFTADLSSLNKTYDIYMYDADHSYDSQYQAITYVWPYLADLGAVIVVDDWNRIRVRQGTLDGLEAVGAHIVDRFEIMHDAVDELPDEFWNGIGIFIVTKL